MPLMLERAAPVQSLHAVMDMVEQEGAAHDTRVREFPVGVHLLRRQENGVTAWNPSPDRVGWLYAVTEGDTDDGMRLALCPDEKSPVFVEDSKAGAALSAAILWAASRHESCMVRLLVVPGGVPAFWALDGSTEVFFPLDSADLMSGPEFAVGLRSVLEGIEMGDWAAWIDAALEEKGDA